MKKAKIFLVGIALMTVLGGAFAFKVASNRNNNVLWTYTTLTLVNGRTYAAIDEFCAPTSVFSTLVGGVLGPVLYTTGPATGTITVTATNNTATTTIPAFDCEATITRYTTAF